MSADCTLRRSNASLLRLQIKMPRHGVVRRGSHSSLWYMCCFLSSQSLPLSETHRQQRECCVGKGEEGEEAYMRWATLSRAGARRA